MGRDKAWIVWGDTPRVTLFARTIDVVSRVAQPVLAVASAEQELPETTIEFELLRDEEPHQGPLVAVTRALEALAGRADLAFVCGTDHPHLVPPVPLRLFDLARGRDAAIPVHGQDQLLCAVYAVRTASVARQLVKSGERSMRRFADAIDARRVTSEELLADAAVRLVDPVLSSFEDVDTPEDLEQCSAPKCTPR